MKISKRRMTKQQTPHVQNKTPHDEIDLTAAVAGREALPSKDCKGFKTFGGCCFRFLEVWRLGDLEVKDISNYSPQLRISQSPSSESNSAVAMNCDPPVGSNAWLTRY